jgi:hypothetical protein
MRGCQNNGHTHSLVKVELVEFFVDLMPCGRISQGNAFIEQYLKLSFQVSWFRLAAIL